MTWQGEVNSNMDTHRRGSVSKALDVVRRGSIGTAVSLVRRNSQLSTPQLERLKDHKYSASGSSLSEVFMQPYWRWLVTKVPLWVAPNLLTFTGLVLNVLTTLPVALWDMNMLGVAPRWTYLLCALGFFIYQSLDAIDGKQARRTGTNSPLGEFFDHGCDAVSTYLVVVSGACAIGGHYMPVILINFVILYLVLNFAYHWQTYASGVLHFKKFDVTEGQFAHIFILLVTGTFGVDFWGIEFPGTGLSFRVLAGSITIIIGAFNLLQSFHVIFTRGAGHNGSTVANTNVLSPLITMAITALPAYFYAYHSNFMHHHAVIFFTALSLPMCKEAMYIVLAAMTKSPFPLLDHIMLGPLFACFNLYLGTPVPEMYLLLGLALYNFVDICVFSIVLVQQICDYLDISCFTIPHCSTDASKETVKT